MAFEEKDMSGVLFENDRKDKDTHPDMTGSVTLGGKKYRLAAWRRQAQNDPTKEFLSIKVSEFER